MIEFCPKEQCVGCFACYNACPTKSIEMQLNKEGFKYPIIDKGTCIDCGKCKTVCPVLNKSNVENFQPIVYGGYCKDQEVRKRSSSGGVFVTLAREILSWGGVVFGAAFSADYYSVNIVAVDNQNDLWKLSGSKYLQSYVGDSYAQAKKYLDSGVKVLFSATPCQIAGLKSFLGKNYDNLITVDFICHGVPSPIVWKNYLQELEKEYNAKAIYVNFRSKEFGWENFALDVKFDNGKRHLKQLFEDIYVKGFLRNLYLRESCYQCKNKEPNFTSDITMGDFWGIEQILPKISAEDGVSCIIIRSKIGLDLIASVSFFFDLFNSDLSQLKELNIALEFSVQKNINRNRFFRGKRKGTIKNIEKFLHGMSKKTKRKLFREDIAMVKKEKGRLYSILYTVKNLYRIF